MKNFKKKVALLLAMVMMLSLVPMNVFGALNEPNSDFVGIASTRTDAHTFMRLDLRDLEGFTVTGGALAVVVSMVDYNDSGDNKRVIEDITLTNAAASDNILFGAPDEQPNGSWIIPVTSAGNTFAPAPSPTPSIATFKVDMDFGSAVTVAYLRVDVLVHGLIEHTIIRPTRVMTIPAIGATYSLATTAPNFDSRLDAPIIRLTEQSAAPGSVLRASNGRIELVLPFRYEVLELPVLGPQYPTITNVAGDVLATFAPAGTVSIDGQDRVALSANFNPLTGILPTRLEIRGLRIVPRGNAPATGEVSVRINIGGRGEDNATIHISDAQRQNLVVGVRGQVGTTVEVGVVDETVPVLEAAIEQTNWSSPIYVRETVRGAWDSSLLNLSTVHFSVPAGVTITGVQYRFRTQNAVAPAWQFRVPNANDGLGGNGAALGGDDHWGGNNRNAGVMPQGGDGAGRFGIINAVHVSSQLISTQTPPAPFTGMLEGNNRSSFTMVLPRALTDDLPTAAAREVEVRFRFSVDPQYARNNENIPVTVSGTAIGNREEVHVPATVVNQVTVSRVDPMTLLPTTRDMFDLIGPFPLPRLLVQETDAKLLRSGDWIYVMMDQGAALFGGDAFGLGQPRFFVANAAESGVTLHNADSPSAGVFRVQINAVGGADRAPAQIMIAPPETGVNTWRMTGPLLAWMEDAYDVDVYVRAAGGDRRATNIENLPSVTSTDYTFSTRPFRTQVVQFPHGEAELPDVAPPEAPPAEAPPQTPAPPAGPPTVAVNARALASNGAPAIEVVGGSQFINLRYMMEEVLNGMVDSTRAADGTRLALFSAPHAEGPIVNITIEGAYPNARVIAMVGLTPIPVAARVIDGSWYVNVQAFAQLFGFMPEVN